MAPPPTPSALWASRARAEADAAGLFAHVARGLRAVDAHPTTVELAERAADDERRHQVVCAELAAHFGGPPAAVWSPVRPAGVPTRESVLLEVIGMCCINETVSTAVLGRMQHETRGAPAHEGITAILRDEVQHARLGWAHLAFEARRGPVDGVAGRLQELVDAAVRDLDEEPDVPVDDALLRAGGLDRRTRVALLRDALKEVVFPGLVAYGIDVGHVRLPR